MAPIHLVGALNPSENYEFVSWDDEIPNIWKNESHVPNHQSDIFETIQASCFRAS